MSLFKTRKVELSRLNGVINNLTHWGPNAESLQRDYDYLLQEFNALQKLHENDLDFDNIATLIDNRKGDFGSYKAVSSAKVNIASFTTLAMEIFGNGGKVLWYLPSDLLVEWGFGMNFEKMPKEVLLDSLGVQSTKKKYTALLNMDQNKYLEITESARSYYMKCQKPYPHQVIKKRIADFIDKKSM